MILGNNRGKLVTKLNHVLERLYPLHIGINFNIQNNEWNFKILFLKIE